MKILLGILLEEHSTSFILTILGVAFAVMAGMSLGESLAVLCWVGAAGFAFDKESKLQ